ncbi:nitrilase-related carbon-nitrogen hydrolase [Jannaschia donghaensis]|uniref:Glutamine-dependent NAD(+) synthetase n=1 Tax=Jannaschia donghaensis TaxID=420998 RepID=A0A0M6YJF5_9RHOB|nr:nitrilase-related carbon-nitrogen hydrolase [Jannaschia donghaensis]CTQ50491.1 Glutamine-dependent NAD(+) synthetase [Jannaschia donghaensis]
MENGKVKVAVAQVDSHLGKLERNVEDHLEVIAEARSDGVDCLLFPEMSLTGHSAGHLALEMAIARDHDFVTRLAQAAGPMCTTFGLIEEGPAAQFYNAAITVRDGRVIHLHRKINLATYGQLDDGKHFAPGRYIETFDLGGGWRAATLICNDLWNPALISLAALHGATLLLAPVSSAREAVGATFDNPGSWDIACRYSSMVYGMPMLFANRVGQEGEMSFWGGSRIVDAFGTTMACADEAVGLTTATLDFEQVRQARARLPTVRDSNLDLLVRETTRLQHDLGVPETVRRR